MTFFGYWSGKYALVVLWVKNLFATLWLVTWILSVPGLLTDTIFTFGDWRCFLVSLEWACTSQRLTNGWKRLLVGRRLFGSWFCCLTIFTIITEFGCHRGIFLFEIWWLNVFKTPKVKLSFIFFADILTDATLFYVDFWQPIFTGPFFY